MFGLQRFSGKGQQENPPLHLEQTRLGEPRCTATGASVLAALPPVAVSLMVTSSAVFRADKISFPVPNKSESMAEQVEVQLLLLLVDGQENRVILGEGMKQHEDVGTQYRSVIYTIGAEQLESALRSKEKYQQELSKKQLGPITTEILEAKEFYCAEDYHQQYLHKNQSACSSLRGTGVPYPSGK
ncbi:Mitochondrial peptide methionine sulfoxide reductase [Varanus komodoensis]|nr:Mitochondrial peptide methionine sulfoxide reductase [Varanus komodoensis]